MKRKNRSIHIFAPVLIFLFIFNSNLLASDESQSQMALHSVIQGASSSLVKDSPVPVIDETDTSFSSSVVTDTQPGFFRMSNQIYSFNVSDGTNITMDGINCSGSWQPTPKDIDTINNAVPESFEKILDIDLRQESHGYVTGNVQGFDGTLTFPVSDFALNNAINAGIYDDKVIENNDILFLKSLHNLDYPLQMDYWNNIPPVYSITINCISYASTEKETVESINDTNIKGRLSYIRLPVQDQTEPAPEIVDSFLTMVQSPSNPPETTWYHFHCKGGQGRTTTFMCMFDIINNYRALRNISVNNIQTTVSDIVFRNRPFNNFQINQNQNNFLQQFIQYCQQNEGPGYQFKMTWSDYCKINPKNSSN